VDPSACVVVGDTEADVAAGAAAGGFGILVPNRAPRRRAVKACEAVAPDLLAAVDLILGCSARAAGEGERPAEAA
jgi:beta-phosphoglucomutase-like phosphatase (HAD superfamily)